MITPPGGAPDKRMGLTHQKTATGEIEPSWRFGKPVTLAEPYRRNECMSRTCQRDAMTEIRP